VLHRRHGSLDITLHISSFRGWWYVRSEYIKTLPRLICLSRQRLSVNPESKVALVRAPYILDTVTEPKDVVYFLLKNDKRG
jgi:hypothetical protein